MQICSLRNSCVLVSISLIGWSVYWPISHLKIIEIMDIRVFCFKYAVIDFLDTGSDFSCAIDGTLADVLLETLLKKIETMKKT